MSRALTALCCLCLGSTAFAQTPNVAQPVKPPIIKPQTLKLPQLNAEKKGGLTLKKQKNKEIELDASLLPPVTGKNGMIAKVNDVNIPLEQFTTQYERFAESFKARKRPMPFRLGERYRKTIMKRIVNEELVRQEAARLKIAPSEAQLDEELKEYKAMFKTEERFTQYLKSSNIDLNKVKDNLTQTLLLKLLLEKANVTKVSDEEIKAHYEKMKSRYEVKEKVRASHILLKVEKSATPEQVNEVLKKAQDLTARARKGEDFAELAKANSEGPTAPRGGDLNFFARNRMVKEFDDKAFTMKIGEISDPVRTRFGWHVIKVTDRKDAHTRTLDEVKDNIRRMLEGRSERQARSELLKNLREKAKVETYLPEVKEEANTTIDLKEKNTATTGDTPQ